MTPLVALLAWFGSNLLFAVFAVVEDVAKYPDSSQLPKVVHESR